MIVRERGYGAAEDDPTKLFNERKLCSTEEVKWQKKKKNTTKNINGKRSNQRLWRM